MSDGTKFREGDKVVIGDKKLDQASEWVLQDVEWPLTVAKVFPSDEVFPEFLVLVQPNGMYIKSMYELGSDARLPAPFFKKAE